VFRECGAGLEEGDTAQGEGVEVCYLGGRERGEGEGESRGRGGIGACLSGCSCGTGLDRRSTYPGAAPSRIGICCSAVIGLHLDTFDRWSRTHGKKQ
jgi:hypothetical protein